MDNNVQFRNLQWSLSIIWEKCKGGSKKIDCKDSNKISCINFRWALQEHIMMWEQEIVWLEYGAQEIVVVYTVQ